MSGMQGRLADPPREVPVLVRCRVRFGGVSNQLGWVFFGFGMIFVWGFVGNADFTSWYEFAGEVERVEGRVIESSKTSMSEGGSEHSSGTPIYANRYTFTVNEEDGEKDYEGISYATGHRLSPGASVEIEFPGGDPSVSRVRGMRRAAFGPAVLFVTLFPIIGLVFISLGWRKGGKGTRLLAHGVQAAGTLRSKEPTRTRINNRTVYRLTFEFTVRDRKYSVVARTHEPERLQDEAEEPLLYDPDDPSRAVMLDELPGSPRIDESGEVRAGSPLSGLKVAVLPAITVLGHGLYAVVTLL